MDVVSYMWYNTDMSRIREAILERLEELEQSRYWLAQEAAQRGIVGNRETVFRYLRGERDTSSAVAAGLLEIVGLELTPKPPKKRKEKRA